MFLSLPPPSKLMPDYLICTMVVAIGLSVASIIVLSSNAPPEKDEIQSVAASALKSATVDDTAILKDHLARLHPDVTLSKSINTSRLTWVDGLKSVTCQPEKIARPEGFFTNCELSFSSGSIVHDMTLPLKIEDQAAIAGLGFRITSVNGKMSVEVAVEHPEKINREGADRAMLRLFSEVKYYLAHYQPDPDIVPKEAFESWRAP